MRTSVLLLLSALVGVGVLGAEPTGEELLAWALRHWDDVGAGRPEAVAAWFAPEAGVAFLGGPVDGFHYGGDVLQAWRAFFAAVPARGVALAGVTRAIPEARLVYGTLELATERGPVVVDSYLRFSPEGKILGADYVLVRGLGPAGPVVDGALGEGEYRSSVQDGGSGVALSWRNGLVVLYAALRSPGTGWVSAGFDPVNRMQGANYVIAAVTSSGLAIEDHFGSGTTSHRRDRREDVLRAAGTVSGGRTTVEFVIPLDSLDPEDKALVPGRTYTVLLAYHRSSTSFTTLHSARGSVRMTLEK
ncbi:MAG: DOMON domain-containing protein [Candidatus Bipolaricaulota bacterium]|nr:DOMON domain-containing protein [Candidatus Bipolaricaulota bacterium]